MPAFDFLIEISINAILMKIKYALKQFLLL